MRKTLSTTIAGIMLAVPLVMSAPAPAAQAAAPTFVDLETNRSAFNSPRANAPYFVVKIKAQSAVGKGLPGKAVLFINGDRERTRKLSDTGHVRFHLYRSELPNMRTSKVTVKVYPKSPDRKDKIVRTTVKDVPRGQAVLDRARAQVGDRYARGGSGPSRFDCSGLTAYAYQAVGERLPHSSGAQRTAGKRVSRSDRQPGDIVWTRGHVSIYAGNGRVVEAANPGTGVVERKMWQRNPLYIRP